MRFEQWLHADPDTRKRALAASLQRIRRLDKSICVWVQVHPQPQTGDGPLSGIPFGAKDIIETRNLVTEYGSPVYKGRRGVDDAAIVRRLKSLGAILVGKTQTAAFAHTTPPPTRNPRNLAHTPGGSSNGSAAAVAAGMIPFSLGTQTGGSVLRPASFCGVTGFKPTYGLFSLEGVLQYAHSLDTLGFFTTRRETWFCSGRR
jgi:Asp-tRNA(Asn)/Glu-tRNA(Gln) amidotransferase A subunit family amidase